MIRPFACCAALPLLLAACGTDSSQDQATDQIVPSFSVDVDTQNDGRTYISAILGEPDSLTDVELKGGDELAVSSNTTADIPLSYGSTLHVYSTTLKGVDDLKTVNFALHRTNGRSAPTSTVSLPDSVAVTLPAANAQVSAASGSVHVTWSNADSDVRGVHFFAYPCGSVSTSSDDQAVDGDPGSFDLPVSSIIGEAPTAAGQCITLTIRRDVAGTFDRAYSTDDKRTFVATKTDAVSFLLTP